MCTTSYLEKINLEKTSTTKKTEAKTNQTRNSCQTQTNNKQYKICYIGSLQRDSWNNF